MPMPEATVDKDQLPASGKNQVWATRKFFFMQPIPIAERMHQASNSDFWLGIFGPNQPHTLAAFSA
jgi:hypothetical protein